MIHNTIFVIQYYIVKKLKKTWSVEHVSLVSMNKDFFMVSAYGTIFMKSNIL